jgi:hypothetical protein
VGTPVLWAAFLAGAVLCGVASQFLLKAGADQAPNFFEQLFRPMTIAREFVAFEDDKYQLSWIEPGGEGFSTPTS